MSFAQQLKDQTAAVKLRRTVFGVRKRLSAVERSRAAHPFHANPDFLAASKKVLDTSTASYRLVTSTISRARGYWKSMTVFYPVKGIRLIRKDMIDTFEAQMTSYSNELDANLDELCQNYKELKDSAREKLGDLFNPSDYPGVEDLREEFSISWEYPSIEPPNFLKELNPKLYEQEQARVAARFDEALAAAEQAMAAELGELVTTLCERLSPSSGKKKSLTPSAINAMTDFVARFRTLNVSSGSDLEKLVNQAEHLTRNIDLNVLKKDQTQQGQLFTAIDAVKASLDQMIVDAPTRKITLDDDDE